MKKKFLLLISTFSLGFAPLYPATALDLELVQAVKAGKAALVSRCLQQGADVNVKIESKTLLMITLDQLVAAAKKKYFTQYGIAQAAGSLLFFFSNGAIFGFAAKPLMRIAEKAEKILSDPDCQEPDSTKLDSAEPDEIKTFNAEAFTVVQKMVIAILAIYALHEVRIYAASLADQSILAYRAILQELVQDSRLDLTSLNDDHQTALDLIHKHVCDNMNNTRVRAILLDAEQLLRATESKHRLLKQKDC